MSLLKSLSLCLILALAACGGDLSPLAPVATTTTTTSTTPADLLSGRVTTGAGAAIANATVTLVSTDGTARTATTGATGAFSFSGLTSGTYSLQAVASGYIVSVATIVFPIASYTVRLTPIGGGAPGLVLLNITGNATLTVGRTSQLTATTVSTDGTTRDVTTVAKWASSSSSLATVSPTGLVTANAPGAPVISATFQIVTGSVTATISK